MGRSYDVLIAGGGVMGSAVACFLALEPDFAGTVAVVERDPGYATSATTRSLGGLRQQFSTPENIAMSRFALELVRDPRPWLEVEGETPELGFREQGYLFLASGAGREVLAANLVVQRGCGAEVEWLEPDALARRFPWLSTHGIAAASLGVRGEGWLDPHALLQAFRRKARSLGVQYLEDTVSGLRRRNDLVEAADLAGAGRVGCGALVNAAGPAAGRLAALAGVDLPVRPRKRQVFVFACRQPIDASPLVIDPSGVYFRPEGAAWLAGSSPSVAADRDCDQHDFELDESRFAEEVWPALAARVPAFEAIRLQSGWVGHYDFNTVDQNAVLGPHPEVGNLWFVNGFSGHGLQHGPAAGRAVAELLVHGEYRTLDLRRFRYERFAAGELVVERAVV